LFSIILQKHVSVCLFGMCVGLFENIALGSVYARDEDDWDVIDKTFSYAAENDAHFFRYTLLSLFHLKKF